MKIVAFVDGGGKWEERPAYIGLHLLDPEGNTLVEEGHSIGDATNNEAEYSAVAMAVYLAKQFGADTLEVYSDSKLVVNQLNGEWRVNEGHLSLYYDEVKSETQDLDFTITWIPRRENQRADKIGRSAIPQ